MKKYGILLSVFLFVVPKSEAGSADTSKYFFSVSAGSVLPVYKLYTDPIGKKMEKQGYFESNGLFLGMHFREKRFGISLNSQFLNRTVLYRYTNINGNPGSNGEKHRISLNGLRFSVDYALLRNKRVHVFTSIGLQYIHMNEWVGLIPVNSDSSNNALRYEPVNRKRNLSSIAFGVSAEWNIWKQDIKLNTHFLFIYPGKSRSDVPLADYRFCGGIGIVFMLENILYKDKINTLKRFP